MSSRKLSLIRWAGSKRRNVSIYRDFFPDDIDKYVEPFAGSAALFFSINPKAAVINDLNGDLISMYKAVVKAPRGVHKHYSAFDDSEEQYYEARREYNVTSNWIKKAGLFLHLNRCCFNGLYRTNRKGEFNVPYGGSRMTSRLEQSDLLQYSEILSNAQLTRLDFETCIIDNSNPSAFFFIDPPYFVSDRRVFREYGPKHFSTLDLSRLQEALRHIDRSGGRFFLSYAYSPEAKQLCAEWRTNEIVVQRHVAGFSSSRKQERELIATNYE